MNLKYHYPVVIFAVFLGLAVYFSFKHEPTPVPADNVQATPQERMDQINLSAMHPEPAPAASSNITDLAQLQTLDEILKSKSDNDPRLDTQLRYLSPAAKALIRGRYATTAPEKRNVRGTIIFLLGRNLSSTDDVEFLHAVLAEPPCRSLAHCDRDEQGALAPAQEHHDSENETTLAYPQLVALKSLESYLGQSSPNADLNAQALAEVEAARHSPVRKVATLADEIAREYSSRRH